MRKFLSGAIAVFMVSAGLVAVAGAAVEAAPGAARACGTQYTPPCVSTRTKATAKAGTKKKRAKVSVQVRANGNVRPLGVLVFVINPGGKKKQANYRGGTITIPMPQLKPGKYTVKISFTPAKISNFRPSTTKVRFKITKR